MKKSSKIRKKRLFTYTATVFLLITAVLFIMPVVYTIANSFMSKSEITANYGLIFDSLTSNSGNKYVAETVNLKLIPDRVSFSQYITVLFKSPEYLIKFWNSVIMVVPIALFQVIFATAAAYGFSRYRGRFREVIFFFYIILMLMPYQVSMVPNYLMANWLNIINTRWAIILPGVFSPFAVFIITKYMRRIPTSLLEAAKIDGAGECRMFAKICVPMSKSIIFSVVILVFIDYWNMVEQPIVLLNNVEMHPLSVFLSKINEGDAGLAFSVATIYMVIPLLIFLYCEEYLVEGISVYSGGIKG